MPTANNRELPRHPDVEQYKKQAKELVHFRRNASESDSDQRQLKRLFKLIQQYHPKHRHRTAEEIGAQAFTLADAQLVLAREHGYPSWPRFVQGVELRRSLVQAEDDPVAEFLRAASVPRGDTHASGDLTAAEAIRAAHPEVVGANIYTAAVYGDAEAVRRFLAADISLASERGGLYAWDPLTYLCFSRYLKHEGGEPRRSEGFVATARALLDAGAEPDTGWFDPINETVPVFESVIYGAAGLAQHAGVTKLLLERGADPNDEETAYHTAESYDHGAMMALVESGRLKEQGWATLLLRKGDWHDKKGMQLLLARGANPNSGTLWSRTPIQHTILRDNWLENIQLQLDHWPQVVGENGLQPEPENVLNGLSMAWAAAQRGRGDVLRLLAERGFPIELHGVQQLIAACALGDEAQARSLIAAHPGLLAELREQAGDRLSEFAGNGNVEGLRLLLDLGRDAGFDVTTTTPHGDGYFDVAKGGTALHSAAWRGRHDAVRYLLECGAAVNAIDGRWRTPLMRAISCCIDSYWMSRRTPESVEMLLRAGASVRGVKYPCGYDEADALLKQYGAPNP